MNIVAVNDPRELSLIVEGHGDTTAYPKLISKIAVHHGLAPPIFKNPLRITKSKLLKPGELERAVELATRSMSPTGRILIVIDVDDDCPATMGPELLERANRTRAQTLKAVTLAKYEFENWFIAGVSGLIQARLIQPETRRPDDPESIRNAKKWISSRMINRYGYAETLNQAAMASALDIDEVRKYSRSFDKLCRSVQALLAP